ncbi:MAG: GNAT family N-acetyltransferase [Candidatus Kryptonium sp.]
MKGQLFEKIETREFTMEDVNFILKVQQELKEKGDLDSFCDKMFLELLSEIQSSGSLFGRIAYVGAKPVGFVFGDTRPKWYSGPECGWLIGIFVLPEYRRQGIGRRLIAEFFDKVRELGLKKVCVMVEFADEETLAFLRKMGFKRSKFVHFEKQIY